MIHHGYRMKDLDAERRNRTAAIGFLLYPVLFSPDMSLEVDRVSDLFRSYPADKLLVVIQDARAELVQPLLQTTCIERLESKPTEDQVRAYLAAVVQRLESDPALRSGAAPAS